MMFVLAGCEEMVDEGPERRTAPLYREISGDELLERWGAYAAKQFSAGSRSSAREFFAEMTAIYFCSSEGVTFPSINCADDLQAYDPATYEVVHAIYRGSADLR